VWQIDARIRTFATKINDRVVLCVVLIYMGKACLNRMAKGMIRVTHEADDFNR
jgi:hypothetical protein